MIETVYQSLGRPFTNDRRILGARTHPARVATVLQQNTYALIKLHGDACDPDSLVFTGIEYEQGYGDNRNPGPIEMHLALEHKWKDKRDRRVSAMVLHGRPSMRRGVQSGSF